MYLLANTKGTKTMTRNEIKTLSAQAVKDGWQVDSTRNFGGGFYGINLLDPKTGIVKSFDNMDHYNDHMADVRFYADAEQND